MLRVGDYLLRRPIAAGAMGKVWRATHVPTNRRVAMKFVATHAVEDPAYLAAFASEVRALAALHHPNIVPVLDFGAVVETMDLPGISSGTPFLVMEYVPRGDLRYTQNLSWPNIHRITDTLLSALAHAHAHGVIHRDVKPGNILIDSDDHGLFAKLADFGIVWDGSEARLGTSTGAGSYGFMSPEQSFAKVADYGPWTDLYAVGCVLWRLICGEPAFEGSADTVLANKFRMQLPPYRPLVPVPRNIDRWLRVMLAPDPRDRFLHAQDARYALSMVVDSQPVVPVEPAARHPSKSLHLESLLPPNPTDLPPSPRLQPEESAPRIRAHRPRPLFPQDWRMAADIEQEVVRLGFALIHLQGTAFAGRTAERDQLWLALREASVHREPAIVRLLAPAGRGGSALADWLMRRANEWGAAHPVSVRFAAEGRDSEAWIDAISRTLNLIPKFDGTLSDAIFRATDRMNLSEDLAARLLKLYTEPKIEPGEVQETARLWLTELGKTRPVVLAMHDPHLAHSEPAFCEYVVQKSFPGELPLLLIEVWSSPESEASRGPESVVRLELEPLSAEDATALVRNLIPLDGPTLADVVQAGHGEPARLLHLLRTWIQSGAIQWQGTGFAWNGAPRSVPTNAAAADWLLAELDRTDDDLRAAADVAIALGNTFALSTWRGACETLPVATTDNALHRLIKLGAILFDADRQQVRWHSASTREAATQTLAGSDRHGIANRRVAASLMGRDHAAAARHWLEAGDYEAAMQCVERGLETARGLFNTHEAGPLVVLWERAATAVGLPEDDPRRLPIWEVHSLISTFSSRTAARQRAELLYWSGRILAVAERISDRNWICTGSLTMAWYHRFGGEYGEAVDWAERALLMSEGNVAQECRVRRERAFSNEILDPQRALHDIDWVVANLPRDSYQVPNAHLSRAAILFIFGRLDEASRAVDDAMRTIHLNPGQRSLVLTEIGKIELAAGNAESAADRFAEAVADCKRRGLGGGYAQCFQSIALIFLKRYPMALRAIQGVIENEPPHNVAEMQLWRAVARQATDDVTGARSDIERSCAWFAQSLNRADSAVDAAHLLLQFPDLEPPLREAAQRLRATGNPQFPRCLAAADESAPPATPRQPEDAPASIPKLPPR